VISDHVYFVTVVTYQTTQVFAACSALAVIVGTPGGKLRDGVIVHRQLGFQVVCIPHMVSMLNASRMSQEKLCASSKMWLTGRAQTSSEITPSSSRPTRSIDDDARWRVMVCGGRCVWSKGKSLLGHELSQSLAVGVYEMSGPIVPSISYPGS
jgi:hypothetical protein